MDAQTEEAYRFDDVEEAFHEALEESLNPHGPEALFDLVATFDLPAGAAGVDVGCGRGAHTRALAERFGFDMLGVDPISRPAGIPFEPGSAERLPLPDESVDLVWCRDVLSHVADLPRAFAEMRRVLRPGGRAMVYLMLPASDWSRARRRYSSNSRVSLGRVSTLLAWKQQSPPAGCGSKSAWRSAASGASSPKSRIGKPGRRLLWAARLLRKPDRYVARFGRANYEVMLGDCLWHVYAMTGKLHRRAYALSREA